MKLLIPLSYLNEACFLTLNVNEKKYKMVLKLAQEQLKTTLGPEFYDEIYTQYSPNSDTFTAANSTLYEDYIKDFLAWQTYLEYLSFAQLESTPSGFREHNDENSTIADDIKYYSLAKNVRLKAEDYKNKMINFLLLEQEKVSTNYPLYQGCGQDTFGFGISSISGKSEEAISIYKAIRGNE